MQFTLVESQKAVLFDNVPAHFIHLGFGTVIYGQSNLDNIERLPHDDLENSYRERAENLRLGAKNWKGEIEGERGSDSRTRAYQRIGLKKKILRVFETQQAQGARLARLLETSNLRS